VLKTALILIVGLLAVIFDTTIVSVARSPSGRWPSRAVTSAAKPSAAAGRAHGARALNGRHRPPGSRRPPSLTAYLGSYMFSYMKI
jgi:hypothetical protein